MDLSPCDCAGGVWVRVRLMWEVGLKGVWACQRKAGATGNGHCEGAWAAAWRNGRVGGRPVLRPGSKMDLSLCACSRRRDCRAGRPMGGGPARQVLRYARPGRRSGCVPAEPYPPPGQRVCLGGDGRMGVANGVGEELHERRWESLAGLGSRAKVSK